MRLSWMFWRILMTFYICLCSCTLSQFASSCQYLLWMYPLGPSLISLHRFICVRNRDVLHLFQLMMSNTDTEFGAARVLVDSVHAQAHILANLTVKCRVADLGPSADLIYHKELWQVITEQVAKQGFKKDKDVDELYLAERNLSEIDDISRFRYLKILWLNGNELRRVNCLTQNYQLAELYLQNNRLVDIKDTLSHLTCLRVLMLQNNQLTKLETVVQEFHKMHALKTLNLFNNPIAQEPDYRLFVIHAVPSVTLLDRQEVQLTERFSARKIYDQNQEKIRETVAFGRRSEGPPSLYYPPSQRKAPLTTLDRRDIGNSFLLDHQPFEKEEDAINARRLKKSVTVFTVFDWSKVPRIQQRRQCEEPFDSPEIITHVYR
ncbi:hypothetical protein ScPMuIL_016405 [Solemya velum]